MIDSATAPLIVVAPGGRDSYVICQMVTAGGLPCRPETDMRVLESALRAGEAAGAVVTQEALTGADRAALARAVAEQPPWSDFPFIVLTARGAAPVNGSTFVEILGNVTLLERPLHPSTLVSAARSALRARARQLQAAEYLAQRAHAEAALRELAETLESRVEERTRQLADANDQLTAEIAERQQTEARLVQSQKMEAIGQLTGGVAHDFNNLLAAVVGSLDLLQRRTDDEKLLRLARNAMQAAERGAKLTGQLLAFSRRQQLKPSVVDVNALVLRTSDLLASSIGPQVEIETVLDRQAWPALVDANQLELMILNLAINARDAMSGEGQLTIRTSTMTQAQSDAAGDLAPGDYLALSVTDTGSGMSEAVLARAFEPFFTTKSEGKGTGLGLSQVYGFARQSGGIARISSQQEKGTSVTIYLPRSELGIGGEETEQPILQGSQARILLVDDDDDVRNVAAAMLEELGYSVLTASSGTEALLALKNTIEIDLLLTDVAMPGMSGVELARRVRVLRPDLRIFFASGYADLDAFGAALSDEDLIKKPYRLADLAAQVERSLAAPLAERLPAMDVALRQVGR